MLYVNVGLHVTYLVHLITSSNIMSFSILFQYGDTSLHTAARYGHAGVTRILISAQCKVSEQNKNGDTALHIAAAMGRRKLTRILLEAGCDKSIRNHQGETARDIATRKGLEEIIAILNTPVAKQSKKKDKRDKSKDRLDEVDGEKLEAEKKRDRSKEKKKKNVSFESPTPQVKWSPYGCHYYPDPKYFPKPKLSSLPNEPLQKGEQYYLDLAGNIKKGPIGAGYTCYCAPFFKHMEEKMNEDKKDIRRHIERAHERLDQKVTDLEMKTKGQISELTRFVAVERAMCKERHDHLEQWLTRGMLYRASERAKKLDFSPKGSLDIPPIKRTRSLEILDSHAEEWNKVHKIIKSFNRKSQEFDDSTRDLHSTKANSQSSDVLDSRSPSMTRNNPLRSSKSSDHLESRISRNASSHTSPIPRDSNLHNVTAEIHVKANKIFVSQSPPPVEADGVNGRLEVSSRISNTRSHSSREYKASDSDAERTRSPQTSKQNFMRNSPQIVNHHTPPRPIYLHRSNEDIHYKGAHNEFTDLYARHSRDLDISHDGYVKFPKQNGQANVYNQEAEATEREQRKSVHELVAQVELQQHLASPTEPVVLPRKPPTELHEPPVSPGNGNPSHGILKMPQQPMRPAPILKEKPPKTKRFSLQNLIPFPTRKTFQKAVKENGNNSESSDEEDNPIRTTIQPGPMKNTNLLQTLPMPNYESVSNKSQSPLPPTNNNHNHNNFFTKDLRPIIPKDAYFHDIPNRQINHQILYKDVRTNLPMQHFNHVHYNYNETGLPNQVQESRNRNPIYGQQNGVFDAMMQDHIIREVERIPHFYSEHLNQNTEVEIANQNEYHDGCYPNYVQNQSVKKMPDHNLLHSRLQSLAINTHLDHQIDRESHNDSGYSTKVYGSSQGPSPSFSGNIDDNLSGKIHVLPNGKAGPQIGTSSLV